MADIYELEAMDGIRMSWNIWPNSKTEAAKCHIPFASLYSPQRDIADLMVCPYEPVRCKSCMACLNPYCRCDYQTKIWICPLCMGRNQLPAHYAAINENNLPAELFPQYCTLEYQVARQTPSMPPTFIFVMDTCVAEDELNEAKASVQQALQMLPEHCQVGLVTFGRHVQVYELGAGDISKLYIFNGKKTYTTAQIKDYLNLGPHSRIGGGGGGGGGGGSSSSSSATFMAPLSECEFAISSALDAIRPDPWPAQAEQRPLRCTGSAIQVATAVLQGSTTPGAGETRLMLLVGGPSTSGPSSIVGPLLEDNLRSHKDIKAGAKKAPLFDMANKFYLTLSEDLAQHGIVFDCFICSLEQVGLLEMKPCVEKTGGIVVQTDTFFNPMFRETFKRLFASVTTNMTSTAGANKSAVASALGPGGEALPIMFRNCMTLEVVTSRDIKVAGLIGPGAKGPRRAGMTTPVSEKPIGIGGTNTWRIPSTSTTSTVCIFYEIAGQYKTQEEMTAAANANQQFFLQFQSQFTLPSGETRLRVTTVTRKWSDGMHVGELIGGFDQEAAAVVTARYVGWKMEMEEDFDATRYLDRTLIALCQRLGDYRKDDETSFNLAPQLSLFPQFLFNLRRSQFIQVFGNSPDETSYAWIVLNREWTSDAIVMIQPSLTAYSFQAPPEAVLLDVASITPERILLLDAYFTVVVFHGTTIAQWRKALYHENPEHAAFAQLLEAPRVDAKAVMRERFPAPRLVDCDQNGSQARFLLAKLNPSATYSSMATSPGEVIMTDDVSLQVFMEHLRKLAVQSG